MRTRQLRALPALGMALLALLVAAGCALPMEPGRETAPGLALEPRESAWGWNWVLTAPAGQGFRMPCPHHGCDDGRHNLRMQAAQADGSFVDTGEGVFHPAGHPSHTVAEVAPGAEAHLGSFHANRRSRAPGTYRAVALVEDDRGSTWEVVREIVVSGWGERTLEEARSILRRAERADCAALRLDAVRALTSHLDPDPLLDLRADLRGKRERQRVLREMYERGSFVHELARELRYGPLENVRFLMRRLRSSGQPPVRSAIAARLLEVVADFNATPTEADYHALPALAPAWPDDGAPTLVDRLVHGPDEGEALANLIDAMTYTRRSLFHGSSEIIVRALRRRCAGQGDRLRASCDDAIPYFSRDDLGRLGIRGFGTSGGCWLLPRRQSRTCETLTREWERTQEAAGPVEALVLESTVHPWSPEHYPPTK